MKVCLNINQSIHQINFCNPCIWLVGANQIPIHLGFSATKLYFSLSVHKGTYITSTEHQCHKLQRAKLFSVVLELNINATSEQWKKAIEKAFSNQLISSSNSCLAPIQILINQMEPRIFTTHHTIHSLIKSLEYFNLIKYTASMGKKLDLEREFYLPEYDKDDVLKHIGKLTKIL